MRRRLRRWVFVLALAALATAGCKPRVLVVGLDGAGWKILDPLMEYGHAPTIARLVENGVKADLDCQPAYPSMSCFCPPVWQSIVTGQPVWVHGVVSFPTRSFERRAPTLWDVNRDWGGQNTLVSLHNLWPPDPSGDVVVTEEGAEMLGALLYDMSDFTVRHEVIDQPATWTRPANLFQSLGLDRLPRGGPAWKPMAVDRVSMEVLRRLALAKRSVPWPLRTPEFDMVLLHSPDRSMHMTWPQIQPQPGDPIDVARLRHFADAWTGPVSDPPPFAWGTVASQLIEADRALGALLEVIRYDYVVLLSDHGMAPTPEGPLPGGHGTPEAFSGIFALYGPPVVRHGVVLPKLSVFDVAPTLAYLLGIPIADDLPGRLVAEAFEPEVLMVAPPQRIATWNRSLPFR